MKVVIAEDCLMFREAVSKLCRERAHLTVVGETSSGQEALRMCLTARPDILLLDLQLDDIDGFTVLEHLAKETHRPRALIISVHWDDYTLMRLSRISIAGFLNKGVNTLTDLIAAVHALARGQTYFPESYHQRLAIRRNRIRYIQSLLTPCGIKVLALIARGAGDAEIASCLGISERTVQGHKSILMHKLNLKGTPKLMMFAQEHGFYWPRV